MVFVLEESSVIIFLKTDSKLNSVHESYTRWRYLLAFPHLLLERGCVQLQHAKLIKKWLNAACDK